MKKSNATFIAAALIAIHLLVFFLFIGFKAGDKKKSANTSRPPATRPSATEPAAKPLDAPDFEVADVAFEKPAPIPEPVVMPVEVVEMKQPMARENIATPGSRKGYLRSDRPNRRTTKVYSKLVGEPYQSAIVVDARTGKILYENKANAYAYPASVTKMMTMLIVLEQIDAGVINLSDKVKISSEVQGMGGSGVYLDTRESGAFTVNDMLNALMIHSANDAATALAIHVAGSRSKFVEMMNQKARELGMNSTRYNTEHGLPPSGGKQPDISTAYDIAILSLAALKHPRTLHYAGTKLEWLPTNSLRKEKFMLANRNALVGKDPYPGCDGLKTGYHSKGGYSLAATAKQGDDRIVSVILGVANRDSRNKMTKQLLDKGFDAVK